MNPKVTIQQILKGATIFAHFLRCGFLFGEIPPPFPTGKGYLQELCQRLQFSDVSLRVLRVHGRCNLVKSRFLTPYWILNPMRSVFAKLCQDAKIFVMRAKFFVKTKNFGFATVSMRLIFVAWIVSLRQKMHNLTDYATKEERA